jgi:peptide deformylase
VSLLAILKWPDPRLAQACAPVGVVTPEIRTLAADMLQTMYAAPGRGLAAPQVGAMLRLFVMDVTWKEGRPDPQVVLDPVIEPLGDAVARRGLPVDPRYPDRDHPPGAGADALARP